MTVFLPDIIKKKKNCSSFEIAWELLKETTKNSHNLDKFGISRQI